MSMSVTPLVKAELTSQPEKRERNELPNLASSKYGVAARTGGRRGGACGGAQGGALRGALTACAARAGGRRRTGVGDERVAGEHALLSAVHDRLRRAAGRG